MPKVEIDLVAHCDEPGCDLGYAQFNCPYCKNIINDYDTIWFYVQYFDKPVVEWICEDCQKKYLVSKSEEDGIFNFEDEINSDGDYYYYVSSEHRTSGKPAVIKGREINLLNQLNKEWGRMQNDPWWNPDFLAELQKQQEAKMERQFEDLIMSGTPGLLSEVSLAKNPSYIPLLKSAGVQLKSNVYITIGSDAF